MLPFCRRTHRAAEVRWPRRLPTSPAVSGAVSLGGRVNTDHPNPPSASLPMLAMIGLHFVACWVDLGVAAWSGIACCYAESSMRAQTIATTVCGQHLALASSCS